MKTNEVSFDVARQVFDLGRGEEIVRDCFVNIMDDQYVLTVEKLLTVLTDRVIEYFDNTVGWSVSSWERLGSPTLSGAYWWTPEMFADCTYGDPELEAEWLVNEVLALVYVPGILPYLIEAWDVETQAWIDG